MASWLNCTYFSFTPKSAGNVTFYYEPLPISKTKHLLGGLRATTELQDLTGAVVSSKTRLLKIHGREGKPERFFAWPETFADQQAVIQALPDTVLVEVGAAVLGFYMEDDEGAESFFDRLKIHLTLPEQRG